MRDAALPFVDERAVLDRWARADGAGAGGDPALWRVANLARWSSLLDVEVT